jgi:apolipoprotein N-acyltransferase
MISMIGIGKLTSAEASQLRGTVASLSRVAIFDGAVLAMGSVATFTYLATRRRWAWVVALVSWGVSIASGIFLAGLSWMEFFVRDPPRGDFAGLVAMFSFALSVALPILLALITSIAAVCLVRARRAYLDGEVPA